MRGLEELIEQAMVLMGTEEAFESYCCNKPYHRSLALAKAMMEVARRQHDEHSMYTAGAYFMGPPPTVTNCPGFPCRVVREFGDLTHERK